MKKKTLVGLISTLAVLAFILAGSYVLYTGVLKGARELKNFADYMSMNGYTAGSSSQSGTSAGTQTTAVNSAEEKRAEFEAKLNTILAYIDYYYYEDADMDVLYDTMLHAAVYSLGDPYSCYYSAKEYADLLESSSGVYSGIGSTISQNMTTGIMTIVTPFANSPAYAAGLRPGDQIIGVDGENVVGQELSDVVAKIKGVAGTSVVITVLRDEEEMDFTVVRATIEVEFVTHKMLEDNIGYILVSEFEETTADQFDAAIDDLQSQGMEALVIDIRSNPGGMYNIVCDMLSRILPKDSLLVYTEDKNGEKEYEYSTTSETLDIPIVVLVNGESASASEIFSGALQYYGAATIMGTQTFGKGIVQSVIPIRSDLSGIKLTSSHYYTPAGICIHGVGITPDVIVELDEGLEKELIEMREYDNQIDAAVELIKEKMK